MRKSISRKAGTIVSASLSVTLVVMVTAMLLLENSAMMNSTDEQVHDINNLLVKALTFSMSQGATDLGSLIDSVKAVRGLTQLRVMPVDKIRRGSEKKMDQGELRVLRYGRAASMKETFRDQPVYRLIEPVVADQRCNRCHESRAGDVLAVVSLRYSLAAMDASLATQRVTGIVFAIIAIGVTLIMSMYFIRKKIIEDLETSIRDIRKLSDGDTSEITETKRDDEIGNLSASLKKLQQSLTTRAEMGVRFAKGDFRQEVVLLSEKDVLGEAFVKISERLKSLVRDAKSLSAAAVEGRLRERADSGKHDGEFRDIIVNFNDTLDAIVLPIKESSGVLEKISKGDLTVRMEGEYRGDYAIIKDSINSLADSFAAAVADVSRSIYATSAAAGEISSSAEQMAVGAHEQSQQAAEVASSVEEMTKTIVETTRNAATAAESAREAGEVAKEGGGAVRDTILGMNRIAERVRKSSESIQALGRSGEEIGRIIQVIDDIADQTNLLALNAAIEAARAGDQGRGFAVVADEVRKLAERTTSATKEISAMIKRIQSDTSAAVESMDEGTAEVQKGKMLTDKAGDSLKRIITSAERVMDIVTQVAAASEEQAASAEQISRSIESISNVTHESATGVQQIAHASEDLSKLTANLQSMISRFRYGRKAAVRDSAPGRMQGGTPVDDAKRSEISPG